MSSRHRYYDYVEDDYESPRDRDPDSDINGSRERSRSGSPRGRVPRDAVNQVHWRPGMEIPGHVAPPSNFPPPSRRPPREPRAWGGLNASTPLEWTKFIFDTPRAANDICSLCIISDIDTPTNEFYGHANHPGADHLMCLEHYTLYRTISLTPDVCPECRHTPMAIWREQRVINVDANGRKRVSEPGEIGLPRLRADVRDNSGGKKRKSTNRRYKRACVTRRGRYNRVRVTRRNHQSKKQK